MGTRRALPHGVDTKRSFGGLILVVLVLAAGVGLALPVTRWFRAREANAAMIATPAPIDGARAYKYLKEICAIGPRPAGSEANSRQRAMVSKHFQAKGAKILEQPFTGVDPRSGERVSMINLIGKWHPDRLDRVVIGVHYDTRPFPDQERTPEKRALPFIGANDCASGVALLMEIANHMEKLPTTWGVDLVLFDGEELVYGEDGEYFLGSKEFAHQYAEGVDTGRVRYRYAAGIVLDMVGGRDLKIEQEENSLNLAPGLVREIWAVARGLKATAFRQRVGQAVLDDHLPLNNAGIPSIDLIHFPYPHWHTSRDTPENCSGASLEQVGRVLTAWLAQPRPKSR